MSKEQEVLKNVLEALKTLPKELKKEREQTQAQFKDLEDKYNLEIKEIKKRIEMLEVV
jgi:esterase/lipase